MAKAYDYVITLKQRSFKGFDFVSQLLIFISLAVFVYTAYLYAAVRIQYGVMSMLIIGSWIYTFQKNKGADHIAYYRFTLMLTAIGWFFQQHGNISIGGLLILVAFLERQVKFPEEVGFNEEGITFNSFPRKEIAWSQVANAVLKDGLLTIDRKNNKLFQKETESDIDPQIEAEFNSFCTKNLSAQSYIVNRTS